MYVGWDQEYAKFYLELYLIYCFDITLQWQIQLDTIEWSSVNDVIRMERRITTKYFYGQCIKNTKKKTWN